jgi:hypothetical protein
MFRLAGLQMGHMGRMAHLSQDLASKQVVLMLHSMNMSQGGQMFGAQGSGRIQSVRAQV